MKLKLEDFKEPGIAKNISSAHANLVALMLYLQRRYAVELRNDPEEVGRRCIVLDDIIEKLDEIAAVESKIDVQRPKRPKLHRGKSHGNQDET